MRLTRVLAVSVTLFEISFIFADLYILRVSPAIAELQSVTAAFCLFIYTPLVFRVTRPAPSGKRDGGTSGQKRAGR
jgi:hypothetical protein